MLLRRCARLAGLLAIGLASSGGIAPGAAFAEDPPDHFADVLAKIDLGWLLLCTAGILVMQAGFLCYWVGAVRSKSGEEGAIRSVLNWALVAGTFFTFGFGAMFGASFAGIAGTDLFFATGLADAEGTTRGFAFFAFQLALVGTALTVMVTAMAGRGGFATYLFASLAFGLFIYPIFGHWAWGNLFYADNAPWLANLGFIDAGGSTVVHSVGAWCGLVGIVMMGPRLGRFGDGGLVRDFEPRSVPLQALGIFLIWIGALGQNAGSDFSLDVHSARIVVNTLMCAPFGGLAAFVVCRSFQHERMLTQKFLGGVLGAVVASAAGAGLMRPGGAVVLGISAGVLHSVAFDWLTFRLRLDDPLGAIPTHGFCGVLGTLAVALLADPEGLPRAPAAQLVVQLVGVVVCMGWVMLASFFVFSVLRTHVGLRVSPGEERHGIRLATYVEAGPEPERMDEKDLEELV